MKDVILALDAEHTKWSKDEVVRREKRKLAIYRLQAETKRMQKMELLSAAASAIQLWWQGRGTVESSGRF